MAALTENPYVKAIYNTFGAFWGNFSSGFAATIRYCFASDVDGHSPIYPCMFALPLVLLIFLRKTPAFRVIITCVAIWLAFVLLQLRFRHYPFMRNMIAHNSVFLATLLLSIHYAAQKLSERLRFSALLPAVSILFCAIMGLHFLRYMNDHVADSLYFNDTRLRFDLQAKMLTAIPGQAAVWTSDESFFPRYILNKKGINVSHCFNSRQTFFVLDRQVGEVPPVSLNSLTRVDSADQYLVYRKK